MKKVILVDFDGTISDDSHRKHFMPDNPDKYYSYCLKDVPRSDVVQEIVKKAEEHNAAVLILTARRESMRGDTKKWLEAFMLDAFFEGIYMRPDKSDLSSFEYKWERIQWFMTRCDIVYIYDNDADLIEQCDAIGLTTCYVGEQ